MTDQRLIDNRNKNWNEAKEFADGWAKLCDEHWGAEMKEIIQRRKEEDAKNPPEPENPRITWLKEGKGGIILP